MLSINFNDVYIYIMVLVRLVGVIAFNPVFAQRGVPARIRAGLVMMITIVMAPTIEPSGTMDYGTFFRFHIDKRAFHRIYFSYVINILLYVNRVGEILDTQFGLSMSKVLTLQQVFKWQYRIKFLICFYIIYFYNK